MIYELRTYQHRVGQLEEFHKRFGEAYVHRKERAPVAASFYTTIGPLNRVMNIWPYQDLADRNRVRNEMAKLKHWPPKTAELLVHQKSEIFVPAPFSPEMATGRLGPIFELRSYLLRPGGMEEQFNRWAELIDERRKVSPLIIAMRSEAGELNKFVHIWGYESLDHREQVRSGVVKRGIWPPRVSEGLLIAQKSMILMASPYSPLQ